MTLAELQAQRAALDIAMAQHELPLVNEAVALLRTPEVVAMHKRLFEIHSELPDGGARTEIGNVLTILTHSHRILADAAGRLASLIPPEPSQEMSQAAE